MFVRSAKIAFVYHHTQLFILNCYSCLCTKIQVQHKMYMFHSERTKYILNTHDLASDDEQPYRNVVYVSLTSSASHRLQWPISIWHAIASCSRTNSQRLICTQSAYRIMFFFCSLCVCACVEMTKYKSMHHYTYSITNSLCTLGFRRPSLNERVTQITAVWPQIYVIKK